MDRRETRRRPPHPVAIGVMHWIRVYDFASGHFRRGLKVPRPTEVVHDQVAALRLGSKHYVGQYHAVLLARRAGPDVALTPADMELRMPDDGLMRRLVTPAESRANSRRFVARPPFECIALSLQGGGAFGSYQAGVYEGVFTFDLARDGRE